MTQVYGGRGKTWYGKPIYHDDDLYGPDAVINYCNNIERRGDSVFYMYMLTMFLIFVGAIGYTLLEAYLK